ncbi:MAG: glycosyltransferase, partial [Armatimonadetes bacterium]|nr:glycosyltransferase [Armatimonadota bacterium]
EHCLSALRGPVDVAYFAPTHLDKIPSSGFDLYLHIDDGFHYTLPDALRPSAWWVIDTHITYDRDRDKATTFDFIFAAQREGAERLLADGLWPVWWLPLACNPEVHRRLEVPQDLDVAFVGNPGSPERQRLLELVQAHFPNSFIGNAYGEEMARVYSRAKVVLNRSIGRDVNMRVFEALASGSLLITNDLSDSGQADLFQDGQNLVTYRTDDELLEKIAYYLAHDGEREAIAHTGREAVLAHHTYAHRMRFILEAVSAQTERQVGEAQRRARPEAYYHFSRPDLAELMAPEGKRLLDVGCAAGRLGEELKRRGAAEVVGVELIPEVATEAKGRLDSVLVADVETAELPWPEDHFDYVICGDLLEHLRDPAAVLRKLARHLKPEGEVIASLPNIRHVAVISELAQGRWRYRMSGILDRDHLRFFTRREARELFRSAGLIVTECRPVPTPQHAQWEAAGRSPNLQLGPLGFQARSSADAEELFVEQWLLRARQHPLASVRGLASIIIPVWNQLEHTRLCLDSLREHTAYPHEIIVVDNGSDDGTPECLAEQADVTVIRNDRNEGFIKACNQGLRASAGDYLVLLNNDTVVTRGWLEGLLSIAEWDPAVGLAGPVSNNVSGPQQIPTGYSSLAAMHEWAAEYTRAHAGHLVEAERLIGFCLFIKRDLLDHIGFLDERFGIGLFDDDDLSLRTRRAGYRLVYTHGVFVHHFGNQTFQALGMDAEALLERNWEQFREKWAQDPQGAEHLGRLYVSVPRSDAAKPAQTGRRIAVVSLLFNWPSTGGGIINTVGMLRGLERAGYEVRHFYAQAAALGVGDLRAPLDTPSVPVPLGDGVPGRQQLGEAFREAVGSFRPDCVIVTDSWTCKPVLAHAAAGYPYLLRFHGLEGLCPLNGIRFVADGSGAPSCQTHLLADAGRCRDCVARHQGQTGTLHAAERAISGAASEAYVELLREALAGSAAVLV